MMFDAILRYADLPVRVLVSLIFIMSGISKIGAFAGTQAYMEAFGLPGILLAPTIGFEIGAGLLLLVGAWIRKVAFVLAGFTLATALVFHTDFSDQIQQIMFLKNLAIAGGLLLLAKTGAAGLSIDGYRKSAQVAHNV